MSPPQQPTLIINNPNSLKIRLAYRFLRNLNNLNTKRFNFDNTHRVKIAAYASMAAVAGSRRAWSRAILSNIRNRRRLARIKKRSVDYKATLHAAAGTTRRIRRRRRRNPNYNYQKGKRQYVDPFGYSGQEVKLRKLVPGAQTMDVCCLLDETADYMKCLATQVEVMRTLVDLYSTI